MKYQTISAILSTVSLTLGPVLMAGAEESQTPATAQAGPKRVSPIDPTGSSQLTPLPESPVLVTKGKVALTNSAWLGIATEDVPPVLATQLGRKNNRGAVITDVVPHSPAALGGLEKHDVIVATNDFEIMSPRELTETMAGKKPGEKLSLKLLRGGTEMTIEVTLGASPDQPVTSLTPRDPQSRMPANRIDPMDVFRQGKHDPMAMIERMEREMERMQEEMRQRFEHSFHNGAGGKSMKQIMSSNGSATYTDTEGTITIEVKNGKKHVKAVDPDGKVLFDGDANSEEDFAKMPESVRVRFEQFDADPFSFPGMGDLGGFDDFFEFDIAPPEYRQPEVRKDFKRIKRDQSKSSSNEEAQSEETE